MPEQQQPQLPHVAQGQGIRAKAIDFGFKEYTKDGKTEYQALVEFAITNGPDSGKRITWTGGFTSDKAVKFSVDTLKVVGWDEKTNLKDWKPPQDREVELTIEHRSIPAKPATPTTPALPARLFAQVRFVNASGGSSYVQRVGVHGAAKDNAANAIMARISGGAASPAPGGSAPVESFDSGGGEAEGGGDGLPF